ncbi:MAG TPA: hypothetical protein VG898_00860 [Solirubrobacterales bacterium]|nr:hypothetical protein [Solirubrobacterales bacterium]
MSRPLDDTPRRRRPRPRRLVVLQALLALALLAVATLPLSAPAVSPEPAQAEVDFIAEEPEDELEEEEWELEEAEEEAEEEEFVPTATAPLPPECLLRTAAPSVVVQLNRKVLRLGLHYTARTPTRVGVSYWLKGGKGSLQLGSASRRFERQGTLHLSHRFDDREAARVRAARVFVIDLDVPAAPSSCRRYLTLRLDAKDLSRSRTTWSERPVSY